MATDIILRSVKASALSHAEMDQNWESLSQTVDAHTSSATIAITDQNKILEVSISSGTMTLPTLANASGTDTDSFRVTVKNIHATSLTVDGNGSETIEGAAGVALLENEAATFALDSGASEWNIVGFYGPNLVGVTSTPAELNILDGALLDTTELNYVNGVTSALQTQLDAKVDDGANSTITSLSGLTTDITVAQGGTGSSTASAARTALGVDAAGTDNSTDVTLAGTPDYITLAGQVLTRNAVVLTTDVSGTLPIANGGTAGTTAAAARTALGVDAAGTDNSTDVTLAGSLNYITLSGQAITRNAIDLAADVSGALPYGNMNFSNDIVADDIAAGAVNKSEIGFGEEVLHAASTSLAGGVTNTLPAGILTVQINSSNLVVSVRIDSVWFSLASSGSVYAGIYSNGSNARIVNIDSYAWTYSVMNMS